MKRVAIISINGTAMLGGVERVVADHQSVLSRQADVRIISLSNRGIMRVVRSVRVLDLLSRVLFPLISSLVARRWAGSEGLVITHGYSSTGHLCDVAFAHGCWAGYTRSLGVKPGPFSRFVLLYERLTARNARMVVLVSERVREQWELYYALGKNKAKVLTNSVDTSIFYPSEEAANPCTGEIIKVLFVGAFTRGKGSEYLAQLHAEIISSGDCIAVCICSPLPVPEEVQQRFPRFRFISRLNSQALRREYNAADLFLLPSMYEAFEMSSLESLACGTPVLLNDTGARPTLEALGCPGVFRLEDESSPRCAILSAARRFMGTRRRFLGEWARSRFDIHLAEQRLLEICDCLGRKKCGS